jgi:hypothetical protein
VKLKNDDEISGTERDEIMDLVKLLTEKNESDLDRAVRIVLGVLFFYLFFQNYLEGWLNYIFIVVGLIALVTGLIGHCTLYTLFGFKTNK